MIEDLIYTITRRMTMKHMTLIAGTVLTTLASSSLADLYTFESTGTITDFRPSFAGADQFPFVGLSEGDSLFYHFEYDNSVSAISDDGFTTTYEFDGLGSYALLGSTRIDFDRIRIAISSDGVLGGGIGFSGYLDEIGVSAGLNMDGAAPMSNELPTSIDINQFTWSRNAGANSDQNQVLFPIVLGTVDTATITPAPASSLLLLAGAGFARRRRSA